MQEGSAVKVESNVTKVENKTEVEGEIELKEISQVDATVVETPVNVTRTAENIWELQKSLLTI